MKFLASLLVLGFLAGCAATSFERSHPKPSLFQTTLPWEGYRLPLPPLD